MESMLLEDPQYEKLLYRGLYLNEGKSVILVVFAILEGKIGTNLQQH
jgi:hypothetical protein